MKPCLAIAVHNMVIPDQVGEWFHLIPAGTFLGRDGRGPYTLADPERVLAEFAARGADLCVDYDHQSLSAAEKQGPVPASGWIKALESREDGIWGRIDWTERAQAHLAAKEYRYLSPVFSFNPQTGEVVRLDGAALTNDPNLHLQAAASRQGASMEEFLEQLRWLLNLPVGATADDIKAHLEKIKQQIEAGQTAGEAMSKLLGLPAGTALAEIATAVQARVGQAPDPAQWVPKAEYERVANALAQNTADQKAARVDQVVRAAMAAAKISPALEGWARDYANRDLEAFNAYVAKTPAIVADAHGKNPPQGDGLPTLTADQEAVARACGLSREAFARTLAGKE